MLDLPGMTYPGPWIEATVHPTRAAIARWALSRVGVYEDEPPVRSHRGPLIDAWNADSGSPAGSLWCANFARATWKSQGVTPLGDGACATWQRNAIALARWTATPGIGDVALYCFDGSGVAHHCGVVVATGPTVRTMEGDTDDGGSPNGVGVFLRDRRGVGLLGYVSLGLSL